MDVSRGDAREALLRHPTEQLITVEQLEAMCKAAEVVVVGPTLGEAGANVGALSLVRMSRHHRGAGARRAEHGILDPVVQADVLSKSDRNRVGRAQRVTIVVRQLEPGDEQQVV